MIKFIVGSIFWPGFAANETRFLLNNNDWPLFIPRSRKQVFYRHYSMLFYGETIIFLPSILKCTSPVNASFSNRLDTSSFRVNCPVK